MPPPLTRSHHSGGVVRLRYIRAVADGRTRLSLASFTAACGHVRKILRRPDAAPSTTIPTSSLRGLGPDVERRYALRRAELFADGPATGIYGGAGIQNSGNTCYLNATLQALASTGAALPPEVPVGVKLASWVWVAGKDPHTDQEKGQAGHQTRCGLQDIQAREP